MTQLSVVIFSSRDPLQEVMRAIEHALTAAKGYSYQLHLFFNGDENRAKVLSAEIEKLYPIPNISVWFFALADKANCMNRYWHDIKPDAEMHFFVDGYVKLLPDSFSKIIDAHRIKQSHAYSGIPANGRSSKMLRQQMTTIGGIHGNLFMLPQDTVDNIRNTNFRLPLGIYRTDPTMAALLCFDFHPERTEWQPGMIQVVPESGWYFENLRWYKLRDVKAHFLRKRRQAVGFIENRAIRQTFAIEKKPANSLPELATDLCLNYLAKYPLSLTDYLKNPLLFLAKIDLQQRAQQQQLLLQNQSEYWKLK
jgi:hypothetical protein